MMKLSKFQIILIIIIVGIISSLGTVLLTQAKAKPTGRGITVGNVSVIITGVLDVNLTNNITTFGSYAPVAGKTVIVNTAPLYNATNQFILENTGNSRAKVYLNSSSNASRFFGTTSTGSIQIKTSDNLTGACDGNTNASYGDNISTEVTGTSNSLLCDNFDSEDLHDKINIHFQLIIPSDSPAGNKVANLTVYVTSYP
jgi:hypothetical protein